MIEVNAANVENIIAKHNSNTERLLTEVHNLTAIANHVNATLATTGNNVHSTLVTTGDNVHSTLSSLDKTGKGIFIVGCVVGVSLLGLLGFRVYKHFYGKPK